MKKKINGEKGFTSIDLGVAMLVVIIFASIMSSVLYSVYLSSTEAKRTAVALNYAVDIFEKVGTSSYSQVTGNEIFNNIDNLNVTQVLANSNSATGKINTYDLKVVISDPYGDNKVKLITLTITYPITAKRNETIELKRIKTI